MPRETNIQIRRGSASDWASVNPTLASGEMAIENDTRKVKVGDGTTVWNELRYLGLDGGDIDGPAPTATPVPPTPTPTVAGDPLWGSVGLLVPFDTNFTDVKSGIVPTVLGSSPTITAEGKFGSYASWSTSGSGLAYSVTAPGTGDFTIECWFRRDASAWGGNGSRVIALGSNSVYVRLLGGDLGTIGASWANDPLEYGDSFHGADFVPTQSQWHHVAIVRQSSRFRFYWNGVQTGNSLPPVAMNLTGNLEVGHSNIAAREMRLDDFRYTLACRYPDGTTFTPPTAAFPTN